jgi:UDP-N-acetylglucosamine 2-epimerase
MNSKHSNLRTLFDLTNTHSKEELKLREFIKIMLELKHSSILNDFLLIYDLIYREIKTIKPERLVEEGQRQKEVENIGNMVVGYINSQRFHFTNFPKFVKSDPKETTKYFQVTVYCFLAELHRF